MDRESKIYKAQFELEQRGSDDIEDEYQRYWDEQHPGELRMLVDDPLEDEDFLLHMYEKLEDYWGERDEL